MPRANRHAAFFHRRRRRRCLCRLSQTGAPHAYCLQVGLGLMVVWVLAMRKLAMNATQSDIDQAAAKHAEERAVNARSRAATQRQQRVQEQAPASQTAGDDGAQEAARPRRRRAQRA